MKKVPEYTTLDQWPEAEMPPNGPVAQEVEEPEQSEDLPTKIIRARLDITGVKPFLWHWFGPDAIPLQEKEKTGKAGNDPEEWRHTYLTTEDGQFFIFDNYVFSSMRNGAKHVRDGRKTLVEAVSSTLEVDDGNIPLDRYMPDEDLAKLKFRNNYKLPVYLDVRSAVNPSTKRRNIRYRVALSPGWKASCTIHWNKFLINRYQMEEIAHKAGELYGIGDGRAIGMGRFTVVFTVLEDDNA